jgi:hypothetical protein
MIFIGAFTGLRRQSVMWLATDDLLEVRAGLFALAWRHAKTNGERACVLPAPLARHLRFYIRRTQRLREELGTGRVFLKGSRNGDWATYDYFSPLSKLYEDFTRRHRIERGGVPVRINNTVLRRTYTTRELYEGRSIWALRAQLGHAGPYTTQLYAKLDRYEHPARVREALDDYGRKALALWNSPLILDDLEEGERAELLGAAGARHQGIGLCRHDRCVKLLNGGPVPCSTCEHLVTGPEFLSEWEGERLRREREIAQLEKESASRHILAQKSAEFKQFMANLAYVRGRSDL